MQKHNKLYCSCFCKLRRQSFKSRAREGGDICLWVKKSEKESTLIKKMGSHLDQIDVKIHRGVEGRSQMRQTEWKKKLILFMYIYWKANMHLKNAICFKCVV